MARAKKVVTDSEPEPSASESAPGTPAENNESNGVSQAASEDGRSGEEEEGAQAGDDDVAMEVGSYNLVPARP